MEQCHDADTKCGKLWEASGLIDYVDDRFIWGWALHHCALHAAQTCIEIFTARRNHGCLGNLM